VFESNVNKLSLLDIKLAGQLSKLYAALPKEQEYINLEPEVPLDTAIKLIEKLLEDTRGFMPQIEAVLEMLQAAQAYQRQA
jgi:hypothetical protein